MKSEMHSLIIWIYIFLLYTKAYLFGYTVLATAGVRYWQSRDNCRVSGYTLGTIRSSNLTTCGLRCLLDQRCLSISYHKSLKFCELHDACYTGCCADESSGWSVYYPMAKNCLELLEHRPEDFSGSPIGGHTHFTDCELWQRGNISAIHMILNGRGIKMKIKYGNAWSDIRGKWGHRQFVEIDFNEDEYITKVKISAEKWITSLHITTNKGKYGTYGNQSGLSKTSKSDGRLLFISGKYGSLVDFLSLHWVR